MDQHDYNSESHRTDYRLGRIEEKLDKLTDVISQLSRIEERSSNQQDAISRISKRLDNYEERIEVIEREANTSRGGKQVLLWIGGALIALSGLIAGALSSTPPPN